MRLFSAIASLLLLGSSPLLQTLAFTLPVRHHRQTAPKTLSSPFQKQLHHPARKQPERPLQALPLTIAASPIGSIGILAFIVLVHEAGHYLAAKRFGVSVEEFSIGFGPKLFGFTYAGDEFNLRALPLGGYVKFPENYNITAARQVEEADYEAAEQFMRNRESGLGYRILNFVTLGALDDKLWQDEKERRKRAAEESAKQQQQTESPWWRVLGGKRSSSSSEQQFPSPVPSEIEYYDDPNLLQNRPWQQRAVVLSAGIVFNLILSFLIYFGQINFGAGLPIPQFDNGIVVSSVTRVDAAASGKLNRGDVIVGINGMPISLSAKPSAFESQKSINDFVAKIRATPEGESLKLSVVHPKSKQEEIIDIQPKRMDKTGPQTIGVLLSPNFVKTELVKTSNPFVAADLAFKYVTALTKETANGLLSFFASLITGGSISNQVSGPIGLIRTGSEVVATKDWTAILLFAAAISINLGVINSIPLPALDGGQLVFVLAEALTGRKVNQRFQEGVTGVAVLFLLLLSAGTFVGDLSSIFGR